MQPCFIIVFTPQCGGSAWEYIMRQKHDVQFVLANCLPNTLAPLVWSEIVGCYWTSVHTIGMYHQIRKKKKNYISHTVEVWRWGKAKLPQLTCLRRYFSCLCKAFSAIFAMAKWASLPTPPMAPPLDVNVREAEENIIATSLTIYWSFGVFFF